MMCLVDKKKRASAEGWSRRASPGRSWKALPSLSRTLREVDRGMSSTLDRQLITLLSVATTPTPAVHVPVVEVCRRGSYLYIWN